jgi:hypothetical protein
MFDDAGNGSLIKASAVSIAAIDNATIDYATGKFTVFTFGPVSSTAGYVRYVSYNRYQCDVTPIANITTNAAGSFSANITVPAVANGSYNVTVVDTGGNLATANLNVSSTIPEVLPIGPVLLLSSLAVVAGSWHFRKRPKITE